MGIPAGIQGALFALSNMVIQSAIQRMNIAMSPPGAAYEPVVRGNTAYKNLEAFTYTATNTVYSAAVSFTSQNLGAKNYTRIRQVILRC
jgi:Na+-driven multidrug efflux pump